MRIIKVFGIILVIATLIFIITNPSYNKFKIFSQDIKVKQVHITTRQVFNGFLFSIYQKEIVNTYDSYDKEKIGTVIKIKYLGLLSNFFELSRENDMSLFKQNREFDK
jgi:hypothetical protein